MHACVPQQSSRSSRWSALSPDNGDVPLSFLTFGTSCVTEPSFSLLQRLLSVNLSVTTFTNTDLQHELFARTIKPQPPLLLVIAPRGLFLGPLGLLGFFWDSWELFFWSPGNPRGPSCSRADVTRWKERWGFGMEGEAEEGAGRRKGWGPNLENVESEGWGTEGWSGSTVHFRWSTALNRDHKSMIRPPEREEKSDICGRRGEKSKMLGGLAEEGPPEEGPPEGVQERKTGHHFRGFSTTQTSQDR